MRSALRNIAGQARRCRRSRPRRRCGPGGGEPGGETSGGSPLRLRQPLLSLGDVLLGRGVVLGQRESPVPAELDGALVHAVLVDEVAAQRVRREGVPTSARVGHDCCRRQAVSTSSGNGGDGQRPPASTARSSSRRNALNAPVTVTGASPRAISAAPEEVVHLLAALF